MKVRLLTFFFFLSVLQGCIPAGEDLQLKVTETAPDMVAIEIVNRTSSALEYTEGLEGYSRRQAGDFWLLVESPKGKARSHCASSDPAATPKVLLLPPGSVASFEMDLASLSGLFCLPAGTEFRVAVVYAREPNRDGRKAVIFRSNWKSLIAVGQQPEALDAPVRLQ